jgi:hypothetical protein
MTPEGLARLKADEAFRAQVYDDATGRPIKRGPAGGFPSIGYGLNLATNGITESEASMLLANRLDSMWADLLKIDPWLTTITPVEKDVVLMVQYNTGDVYAFVEFLEQLRLCNLTSAANELMNSRAAHELPERYARMSKALIEDHW